MKRNIEENKINLYLQQDTNDGELEMKYYI